MEFIQIIICMRSEKLFQIEFLKNTIFLWPASSLIPFPV